MTIDEAIENLKAEKRRGTKSVIIAWWAADMFGHRRNLEKELEEQNAEVHIQN